jgi:hypothetical protein
LRDITCKILTRLEKNLARIQIQREVHVGVLSGNGFEQRCRVELVTKITPGFPSVRQLDIWIEQPLPRGDYKLLVNGAILGVRFERGVWMESVA